MYCLKCGDVLKEQRGVFVCERGQMELSQHIAEQLYSMSRLGGTYFPLATRNFRVASSSDRHAATLHHCGEESINWSVVVDISCRF
jgi:hypothetical protein